MENENKTVDEIWEEVNADCEKFAKLVAIKEFRNKLLEASEHCLFYGMLARGAK